MDTILAPIMWLVSWGMYGIHWGLTNLFGLAEGSGPAWVLSVVGLTIVVRLLILPLYNKQINATRQTQILQPEIQKIQKKYKGKKDTVSQQRQQEEMSALYKKHGTSPFASCLPMLVQMPILFSLFRVLYAFPRIAEGERGPLGPIDVTTAEAFENSTVFGAPLSASFGTASEASLPINVRIVAGVLVAFMVVSMFYTQKQLTMKNMPDSAMDPSNPAFKTQKYMLYGMPFIYLFSGAAFQVGVLVYWAAGNIWNIGQQTWFIRNNPTLGSQAYRERQERLRKKRLRKGMSEEEAETLAQEEAAAAGGQRQQPMSKERAKKAGVDKTVADSPAEVEDEDIDPSEVRGKDGLTDAERARKRYERRQAERARSKAKQEQRKKKAQQNNKKRNF